MYNPLASVVALRPALTPSTTLTTAPEIAIVVPARVTSPVNAKFGSTVVVVVDEDVVDEDVVDEDVVDEDVGKEDVVVVVGVDGALSLAQDSVADAAEATATTRVSACRNSRRPPGRAVRNTIGSSSAAATEDTGAGVTEASALATSLASSRLSVITPHWYASASPAAKVAWKGVLTGSRAAVSRIQWRPRAFCTRHRNPGAEPSTGSASMQRSGQSRAQ